MGPLHEGTAQDSGIVAQALTGIKQPDTLQLVSIAVLLFILRPYLLIRSKVF